MARFNRTRLIEQMRVMAVQKQKYNRFDHNNGTAQLRPEPCDENTDALIDKAVAYGYWRMLHDMADELESGTAGT